MVSRIVTVVAASLVGAATARSQWTATEEAELTGQEEWDDFGESVAVSGDTIVVGAPGDDHAGASSGAATVFVRNGTSWIEQARLTASDGVPQQRFGWSVALSGDTVVVGAPGWIGLPTMFEGSAYVFVRNGASWTEEAKLTASDGELYDDFGASVTVESDTAVVGAWLDDHSVPLLDAGSAYVFVRSGTTWSEQQKLVPLSTEPFHEFGVSLSLSSERVLIGAHEYDYSGAVYVFARSGSTWNQEDWFSPSGNEIGDFFGESVALSDGTALIGAFSDTHNAGAAAAYVFVRDGGYWHPQQKLSAAPGVIHQGFGASVALDGDLAAVGHTGVGTVDLFKRSGIAWEPSLQLGASAKELGYSVGLSDNTVVAGAPFDGYGTAHVFGLASPATIYCTAGISASGCQALLHHLGGPSASAPSGFSLVASEVEGAKDGLYYFGTHGRQANPWGNGTSYQCVVPPLVRLPLMAGTGTVGQCDGWFALDLNALWCPSCPSPAKNPGSGATVQAQLWYRDPLSTSNQTTSLSDAVEFGVGL